MRNLKNKNVIITGGASGIGYATALLLLEEQCNVMIAGKSEDGLDKALSKLPSHAKNRCHTVACDILVIAEVEKLATNSRSKFGSIDFLFANAGIGIFKPFLEITEEDFEQVINTNLTGTCFTIQKLHWSALRKILLPNLPKDPSG